MVHGVVLALALVAEPTMPASCKEPVAEAERVGRELFEHDQVGAWATDALEREEILQRDRRLRGWVTLREGGGWVAVFLGEVDGEARELYRVRFAEPSPGAAAVERLDPAQVPAEATARMFRARKTAIGQPFASCSKAYNTVVLPEPGQGGWRVYLLAATTNPHEVVIGGHLRRRVSADGAVLLATEPLSKSCMNLPFDRESCGGKPGSTCEGLWVTNLLWPCPTEAHVYLSLLHRTSIYVVNSGGNWAVEGGKVRFLGDREPEP